MEYLKTLFIMLNSMSPYLLLGFLFAGILHAFIPKSFYRHNFNKPGISSIIKATLFGIPLPLCSCGTIPVAMALHREGATKGATVSFLIATPQTGVDSIVVTWRLLGLPMAIVRPLAAIVTALFGGFLTDKVLSEETCQRTQENIFEDNNERIFLGRVLLAIRYGFFDILQNIGTLLIIGLLIAVAIKNYVPDEVFTSYATYPLLNMVVVVLLAVPMYLCATGSIPIAAALMMKGVSPGVALVLLMAGPAASMASIMIVGKAMGRKALICYLISIILGSILIGTFIDYCLPREYFTQALFDFSSHHSHGGTPLEYISTIIFCVCFSIAIFNKYFCKKGKTMESFEKTYSIKGMTCNHCKAIVEKSLSKLEGVKKVEGDVANKCVLIEGDVDVELIKSTINELGFEFCGEKTE